MRIRVWNATTEITIDFHLVPRCYEPMFNDAKKREPIIQCIKMAFDLLNPRVKNLISDRHLILLFLDRHLMFVQIGFLKHP